MESINKEKKRETRGKEKRLASPPLCSRRPHCKKPLVELIDYMTKRSVNICTRVWHGIYLQREKERNEGKGKRGLVFPLSALAALIVKNHWSVLSTT
jgi:hypothetical protein